MIGRFVSDRTAATRRLSADVDAAAARLRKVYVAQGRPGLGERAREEFADRLAEAVGAAAAGRAAEREWRRNASRACGTPWLRLWRWYENRGLPGSLDRLGQALTPPEEELTARQRVEQAVRIVADDAADGLPGPWAQAVREAAFTGAQGLPEALDELAVKAGAPGSAKRGGGTETREGEERGRPARRAAAQPPRPKWWPAAVLAQASMTLLQIFGGLWLVGQIIGVLEPGLVTPALIMLGGVVGGPLVEWACAAAIRDPPDGTGRTPSGGCARRRPAADGPGSWTRSRPSWCATGKCASGT